MSKSHEDIPESGKAEDLELPERVMFPTPENADALEVAKPSGRVLADALEAAKPSGRALADALKMAKPLPDFASFTKLTKMEGILAVSRMAGVQRKYGMVASICKPLPTSRIIADGFKVANLIPDVASLTKIHKMEGILAVSRMVGVQREYGMVGSVCKPLPTSRIITDGLNMAKPIPDLASMAKIPKIEGISAVSRMAAFQREYGMVASVCNPSVMESITQKIADLTALNAAITAPFAQIQELVRSQASIYDAVSARLSAVDMAKLTAQFAQTNLAWTVASNGLVGRLQELGLMERRSSLSARLFQAPSAYTVFVQQTTDRLAADPEPKIATRLRGSLNLAEYQLLRIADTVSNFIVLPDDEEAPDEIRLLNAPFTQQEELLGCDGVEDESDIAAMTAVSPTAQSVRLGRRVLELVAVCNEAGKTSGYGIEIFKPTTRLMTVFTDLPWLSSTDRLGFGNVIDCLYFIFYEGAGKDNLRFLQACGGPLTADDCDLIWCIKHLRNKWARHDADHGSEREIQKSWAQLAEKFKWLGLADHPSDPHHFQQLQYKLLLLAEDFLVRLLKKLPLKQ